MVGVDDRLYLKSYTPIIPLRYFTGKTIIYKILGEMGLLHTCTSSKKMI